MAVCWNCGKEYDPPDLITRESECPHCTAFLRCCRGCEFYDPGTHNDCREPQAELVADKEIANACDYFRAAAIPRGAQPRGRAKRDLNDLFKD